MEFVCKTADFTNFLNNQVKYFCGETILKLQDFFKKNVRANNEQHVVRWSVEKS